jgi:dihydroxyacetone kinase-like predicted kinase
MAAEQCAPLTREKVVVIPTKTLHRVFPLFSVWIHTPKLSRNNRIRDRRNRNVHTALITYAADSDFDGYEIKAGDISVSWTVLSRKYSDISTLIERLADMLEQFEPEFIHRLLRADVDFDDAEVVGGFLPKNTLVPRPA